MEVEWKFLAKKRVDMESVTHRCAAMGWTVAPVSRRVIHDVYYDTQDRQVLAEGRSVRCRRELGAVKLTLKGPARPEKGLFQREEWEGPLSEKGADYFDRNHLIPTLRVNNTRRTFLLTLGEAEVELALDALSYRLGGKTVRDCQVELELKSQEGLEALKGLGEALSAVEGLEPMTQSKYQRGMALAAC